MVLACDLEVERIQGALGSTLDPALPLPRGICDSFAYNFLQAHAQELGPSTWTCDASCRATSCGALAASALRFKLCVFYKTYTLGGSSPVVKLGYALRPPQRPTFHPWGLGLWGCPELQLQCN